MWWSKDVQARCAESYWSVSKDALLDLLSFSAPTFLTHLICQELQGKSCKSNWKVSWSFSSSIMTPQKCDWATSEFKSFLVDELSLHQLELQKFSPKEDRLDEFYFKKLNVSKPTSLPFFIKMLLTLSHGQAAVERGFSANNTIQENISVETINS